jgi:hypothetical protein
MLNAEEQLKKPQATLTTGNAEYFLLQHMYRMFKNDPVRLLGTMFTNAISCYEPGSQESYTDSLVVHIHKRKTTPKTLSVIPSD